MYWCATRGGQSPGADQRTRWSAFANVTAITSSRLLALSIDLDVSSTSLSLLVAPLRPTPATDISFKKKRA
jgi:hypothetical protein